MIELFIKLLVSGIFDYVSIQMDIPDARTGFGLNTGDLSTEQCQEELKDLFTYDCIICLLLLEILEIIDDDVVFFNDDIINFDEYPFFKSSSTSQGLTVLIIIMLMIIRLY